MFSCVVNVLMVGIRYDCDVVEYCMVCFIEIILVVVVIIVVEVWLVVVVRLWILFVGNMVFCFMIFNSEKNLCLEVFSVDIVGCVVEFGGGSWCIFVGCCIGSGFECS